MNRFLRTAAVAAAVVVGAASAQAATSSGSVQLRGTVQAFCTVQVVDKGISLDLVQGESSREVAEVTENCNNGAGYDIRITSQNNGALVNSANNGGKVDYQIQYDGQGGSLSGEMKVNRSSAQFSKKSKVNVTLPASSTRAAGSYADTVTIQIAAK